MRWIPSWLRSLVTKTKRRPYVRNSRFLRPVCEALEDRTAPAALVLEPAIRPLAPGSNSAAGS